MRGFFRVTARKVHITNAMIILLGSATPQAPRIATRPPHLFATLSCVWVEFGLVDRKGHTSGGASCAPPRRPASVLRGELGCVAPYGGTPARRQRAQHWLIILIADIQLGWFDEQLGCLMTS